MEFMKLWHQYDSDNSGYIEADELKVSPLDHRKWRFDKPSNLPYYGGESILPLQNFLRDLLKEAKKSDQVTDDQLIEYTDTMVRNEN